MRVAVVGGTGPFGRALALRLHESGLDVIVGSRDAERAAATALELDCVGETNGDACADADFIVLAVNAEAALDTARELRSAIGETPVLSVASELRFSKDGVFPVARRALSGRAHPGRARRPCSSRDSTRSRHRASAPSIRPTRTRSSAVTTPTRRRSASSSPNGSPPAARSTQARSRAPARSRASRPSS